MTNTLNNVPRELLERVAKPVLFKSQEDAHADACAAIRALLSAQSPTCCGHAACNSLGEPHPFCNFVSALDAAPSPPGVDGLEVVGYLTPYALEVDMQQPDDVPLCRLSDAQAIIDGLRGELGAAVEMLAQQGRRNTDLRKLRDQLAGLLREIRDSGRYASIPDDITDRIDAALAELKP